MATVKISYASPTFVNCTIASLASSSTLARSSASIDNSSNLYDDALLYLSVKVSGTAIGQDKAVYVYVYGAGGTSQLGSDKENVGTDASVNLEVPTNLLGPVVIACPGTARNYTTVFPIAPFFSGRMPKTWGFVVRNSTNQLLDPNESYHQKHYTGITYTVV